LSLEEMSYDEVARTLDAPLAAVLWRLKMVK
jgi:DNA-directed RNA polymerase specialized sigma24 family protein